ncbi:MAG: hypothetical protein CTY33_10660 [Methylotenera sp.]|nr:MAG: hypothetical protein CTY33_10660 [Methylotenera sp.]
MQLATPFLIPSATDISERPTKKPTSAKVKLDSSKVLASDQTTQEAPTELAHQNLARLLASCGDCV